LQVSGGKREGGKDIRFMVVVKTFVVLNNMHFWCMNKTTQKEIKSTKTHHTKQTPHLDKPQKHPSSPHLAASWLFMGSNRKPFFSWPTVLTKPGRER
jgi:hypothetical protein